MAFPDADGTSHPLAEWKGRVILLNFWAPWCPPCRQEMPDLMKLQAQYATRGFTVIGIAIDTADNAAAFTDSLGINYPDLIGAAKGLALAKRLGDTVGVLPYSVLLDRRGRVVYTHRSRLDPAAVVKVLVTVL